MSRRHLSRRHRRDAHRVLLADCEVACCARHRQLARKLPIENVPKVLELHSGGGRVGGSQLLTPLAKLHSGGGRVGGSQLLTPLARRLRSSGGRVGGSQLLTPEVHLVMVGG